jgi:hypothetical protein
MDRTLTIDNGEQAADKVVPLKVRQLAQVDAGS